MRLCQTIQSLVPNHKTALWIEPKAAPENYSNERRKESASGRLKPMCCCFFQAATLFAPWLYAAHKKDLL